MSKDGVRDVIMHRVSWCLGWRGVRACAGTCAGMFAMNLNVGSMFIGCAKGAHIWGVCRRRV